MEDAKPQPVQPASAPAQQQTSHKANQPERIGLRGIKTAEQLRQELERREDVAVMSPTDQDIEDYLELWQMTQDKGAAFAGNWRRVIWQNPSLDYAQKWPVSNSAVRIYDEGCAQNEGQQLKMLAKKYGLILFFRSNYPRCHVMTPTLKMLSDKHGIEALPVSVDDMGLPEFPNPRNDRVQVATWGIERMPILFIGSRQTGDRASMGFEAMTLAEIISRIFTLTGTKPGDNF